MHWKERILQGSYRDIPFILETSDGDIGRRVALHEYPLRDVPYAEDLGRKARRLTLEIVVLGAEYMARRDQLIAALETPGPGTLIHPYLGSLTVSVLEVRGPRESTREGGSARFTITVVESGEALFPAAIVDTAQSVQDKADGAGGAICDSFGGTFNATDGPAFVFEHSKTLIAKVTDQLDALRRQTPGVPSKITQYVADLKDFSASVESLIRTPADLAVQIYGLIADLARLPDRPIRALNAYRPLWDALSREPDIARTTGVRSMQADNQAALTSLVRRAAVTEAVRTSAVIEYDSYDDAVALRDELAARIDVEIETADDQSYRALTDLRVALVRDMASRAADLARVVRFTPSATVPAVVLAHRLYDDPGRESEIVARNRIRHPGFIVGGTILEVLTDA